MVLLWVTIELEMKNEKCHTISIESKCWGKFALLYFTVMNIQGLSQHLWWKFFSSNQVSKFTFQPLSSKDHQIKTKEERIRFSSIVKRDLKKAILKQLESIEEEKFWNEKILSIKQRMVERSFVLMYRKSLEAHERAKLFGKYLRRKVNLL